MEKATLRRKIFIAILSLIASCVLFLSVNTLGSNDKGGFNFSTSTEGVYVIENIPISYIYDENKYEVVPFIVEPYAVVKGNKQLINLLKWSGNPEFYIDLTGKLPGTYREEVNYNGINKQLEVEIYPGIVDLRLMEQQTVKFQPVIELVGTESIDDNYIVGIPEIEAGEVMIRDIQDVLNQVGSVKGIVNVEGLTKDTRLEVKLSVYDKSGNIMKDINLIDTSVMVNIPIDQKVTVIKEEVVKEIIVTEEVEKLVEVEKEVEVEVEKEVIVEKEVPVQTKPDPVVKEPEKEGILSFQNIPKELTLVNKTGEIKWTGNVKVDLKGFKAGLYEMNVNDNGIKKIVKFELVIKEEVIDEPEKEEGTENTITDEVSKN